MLSLDLKDDEFPGEKKEDGIPDDARRNVKKPRPRGLGGHMGATSVVGCEDGATAHPGGQQEHQTRQHLPALGSTRG